jgi:hypothetical protein
MDSTIQFSNGQKVKCIADKFDFGKYVPDEYHSIILPKKGETYTIRRVVITDFGIGLLLEEIENPEIYHVIGGNREPIFGSNRFIIIET